MNIHKYIHFIKCISIKFSCGTIPFLLASSMFKKLLIFLWRLFMGCCGSSRGYTPMAQQSLVPTPEAPPVDGEAPPVDGEAPPVEGEPAPEGNPQTQGNRAAWVIKGV
jgi:hypothetical protein